jgi:hypothetical protein
MPSGDPGGRSEAFEATNRPRLQPTVIARLAALGYTPETDPNVIVDGPHVEICFQEVEIPWCLHAGTRFAGLVARPGCRAGSGGAAWPPACSSE